MITEQNYLRMLQGTEATLGQVFRFLQFTKRPSAKMLLKIRSDIKGIIVEEMRQNRKKQVETLREEQQKKDQEHQLKMKELQKKTRQQQSDD